MSYLNYVFFSLIFLTAYSNVQAQTNEVLIGKKIHTLAFGSCFKHRRMIVPGASRIFDSVVSLKPDSWLWLGDFAYLDDLTPEGFVHNSLEEVKKRLDESYNDPCKFINKLHHFYHFYHFFYCI